MTVRRNRQACPRGWCLVEAPCAPAGPQLPRPAGLVTPSSGKERAARWGSERAPRRCRRWVESRGRSKAAAARARAGGPGAGRQGARARPLTMHEQKNLWLCSGLQRRPEQMPPGEGALALAVRPGLPHGRRWRFGPCGGEERKLRGGHGVGSVFTPGFSGTPGSAMSGSGGRMGNRVREAGRRDGTIY